MQPQRMCTVCRERKDKSELLRITKSKDGIFKIDEGGKAEGRGAYICKDGDCIKNAIRRKALERSLRCRVAEDIYEKLSEICNDNKN